MIVLTLKTRPKEIPGLASAKQTPLFQVIKFTSCNMENTELFTFKLIVKTAQNSTSDHELISKQIRKTDTTVSRDRLVDLNY